MSNYKYFTPTPGSLDALKKMYKKLAFELHPDHGGSNEAFKKMQNEYKTLLDYFLKFKFDQGNESDQQKQEKKESYKQQDKDVREKMQQIWHLEGITIEIIGTWLWITGDTYSVKDTLNYYGFKFSGRKKAWYWHSGKYKKKTRKNHSLKQIRKIYGTEEVKSGAGTGKTKVRKI